MINVEIKINNEAEVLAQINRLANSVANLTPLKINEKNKKTQQKLNKKLKIINVIYGELHKK